MYIFVPQSNKLARFAPPNLWRSPPPLAFFLGAFWVKLSSPRLLVFVVYDLASLRTSPEAKQTHRNVYMYTGIDMLFMCVLFA